VTVVSGGIKNAPWVARRVVKNKINKDSACVGDKPIFQASIETRDEERDKKKKALCFFLRMAMNEKA
jgi:hypothetical protein